MEAVPKTDAKSPPVAPKAPVAEASVRGRVGGQVQRGRATVSRRHLDIGRKCFNLGKCNLYTEPVQEWCFEANR